jgi:hypothetical protein
MPTTSKARRSIGCVMPMAKNWPKRPVSVARQCRTRGQGPQRPAELPPARRRRAPQTSTGEPPKPDERPDQAVFTLIGRIVIRTPGDFRQPQGLSGESSPEG